MDDGVRARLQAFLEMGGFDKTLVGLELIDAESGKATLRISVARPLQNLSGNLHGGAVATLVDEAGTIAIMTADRDNRPGVTTDLNVSYFSSARADDVILIKAEVLKSGKRMAYVSVDLLREHDGVRLAQGRMTKFLD
jgi:acyl-coenzyme A thioesterase 13